MIYYHFHSKKDLYSTVLRSIFTTMGDGLTAIASSDAAPPTNWTASSPSSSSKGRPRRTSRPSCSARSPKAAAVSTRNLRGHGAGRPRHDRHRHRGTRRRTIRPGRSGPSLPHHGLANRRLPRDTPIRSALAAWPASTSAGSTRNPSSRISRCSTGTPSCPQPPARDRPERCHDPAQRPRLAAHPNCRPRRLHRSARARGLREKPPTDASGSPDTSRQRKCGSRPRSEAG